MRYRTLAVVSYLALIVAGAGRVDGSAVPHPSPVAPASETSQVAWRYLPSVMQSPHLQPQIAAWIGNERITGLTVLGGLAYLVMDANWADRAHLRIVDLSDPVAPRVVGRTGVLPGGATSERDEWFNYHTPVAVEDGRAYVLRPSYRSLKSWFDVVDVADPNAPRLRSSLAIDGYSLAVRDGYAYVCGDGLQVIDVRNISRPRVVAVHHGLCGSSPVLQGDYLYTGHIDRLELLVVDIGDPFSPHVVGRARVIGFESHIPTYQKVAVAVDGDYAFAATSHGETGPFGVRAYDVSNPSHPIAVGEILNPGRGAWGPRIRVAAAGHRLYVADRTEGLFVFDVSDPSRLRLVSAGYTPNGTTDVVLDRAGHDIYLAVAPRGIRILRRGGTRPLPVGEYRVMCEVADASIQGAIAYVATCHGLSIVNLMQPAGPSETARLDLGSPATWVAADDGRVFVGTGDQRLMVVDAAQPAEPRVIGDYDVQLPNSAGAFHATTTAVTGPYVLALYNGALHVIVAADPANMHEVARLELDGYELEVDGELAFVAGVSADRACTLSILSFSSPEAPSSLAILPLGRLCPGRLSVSGKRLFGTLGAELIAFDIADPEKVVPLWRQQVDGRRSSLAAHHDLLFSTSRDGLQLYSAAGANRPRLVGSLTPVVSTCNDLAVVDVGRYVCLASPTCGLVVIDPWR